MKVFGHLILRDAVGSACPHSLAAGNEVDFTPVWFCQESTVEEGRDKGAEAVYKGVQASG